MDSAEPNDVQSLVNLALEAWGTREGFRAAQKVIEVDPTNPDILGLLATAAENYEDAIDRLTRALASAEERLGPNFEKKYKGIFWIEPDTRPYMRVLAIMADLEEAVGHRKESIKIHERMLKLNPNDNQGIRYKLIGRMLAERMLVKVRKLLETYPDEDAAWFTWGAVLYHFVMKDRATATKLLKKARKANPFVEHYLSGAQQFPEEFPDSYCLGDEDEAVLVAGDLIEAWSRRQHALLWLGAQLSGDTGMVRYVARIIDGRG